MSHKVYKVSYVGVPRNRYVIFVERNADGTGQIFQVAGDIQNGMAYGHKPGRKVAESGDGGSGL